LPCQNSGEKALVDFHRGQTYRRPDDDPRWCARALDEIARTFMHPIRVRLVMRDGESITGNLVAVKGSQVTIDMPRESLSLAVDGDEIDSFRLIPPPSPDTSEKTRGIRG
jgi:hypothetical protein